MKDTIERIDSFLNEKINKKDMADEIDDWNEEVPGHLRKKFDKILDKYLKGMDRKLSMRDCVLKLSDKKAQNLYDELGHLGGINETRKTFSK